MNPKHRPASALPFHAGRGGDRTTGKTNLYRQSSEIAATISQRAIPQNRRIDGGLLSRRVYRGRMRWVAGYKWHRPLAHHFSGIVYECVLAQGDTPEEALRSLRDAVLVLNSRVPPQN